MILLALLALALGGAAVAALARSLALSQTRVAAHLDELGAYGYAATAVAPPTAHAGAGPLAALAARLGDVMARRMGAAREADLRTLLTMAGMHSTSPRTVLGYRVLGTAALAVGTVALAMTTPFMGPASWTSMRTAAGTASRASAARQ